MKGSLRIGRIAGIEIGVHYTWLFAFFLIGISLAQGYFGGFYPRWSTTAHWTAGFLSAVLLFVGVLLHELAHSLVARMRGLPVASITLFIFGGVSNLSEEPESPGVEFWMAIVGPLTSLAIGLVAWVLWFFITGTVGLPMLMQSRPLDFGFATGILGYIAFINMALAVFNLLPGFPLDGGRVLRSLIWKASGSLVTSTNVAATIGRVFGWGFIALGVFMFFRFGDFISAIWIAVIGVFLNSAAESTRQEVALKEQLAGVRVSQAMELNTDTVSPNMSVADLVRDVFLMRRRRAIPVADGSEIMGMVSVSDVRELPQEQWAVTPVTTIMTRPPVHTVSPEDGLGAALKLIAQFDLNQVPVVSHGKLVGLLSRANVISFLQMRQELGGRRAKASRPA